MSGETDPITRDKYYSKTARRPGAGPRRAISPSVTSPGPSHVPHHASMLRAPRARPRGISPALHARSSATRDASGRTAPCEGRGAAQSSRSCNGSECICVCELRTKAELGRLEALLAKIWLVPPGSLCRPLAATTLPALPGREEARLLLAALPGRAAPFMLAAAADEGRLRAQHPPHAPCWARNAATRSVARLVAARCSGLALSAARSAAARAAAAAASIGLAEMTLWVCEPWYIRPSSPSNPKSSVTSFETRVTRPPLAPPVAEGDSAGGGDVSGGSAGAARLCDRRSFSLSLSFSRAAIHSWRSSLVCSDMVET